MLLGREEVNPNRPDDGGKTRVRWSTQLGCEAVVIIVFEQTCPP